MAVFLRVAFAMAATLAGAPAGAKIDAVGNADGKTKAELVVPGPNDDLSASRIDCEVFGWNQEFTEVAAVGSDLWRGPRGRHRGHAFLLVYEIGQFIPLHNIIAHVITHPDLPDDPVPLDDARDLTWVIDVQFQKMWPRRPHRTRPATAMRVTPLWYPVAQSQTLCTPAVGFVLEHRGQRRFHPFGQVDMKVTCANLRMTDSRTYWGRNDLAAAMMRWDFSASAANERSARFVISAAWTQARPLQLVLEQSMPLEGDADKLVHKTLRALGTLRLRKRLLTATPEGDAVVQEVAVHGPDQALGEYIAYTLHAHRVVPLPASVHEDVVVRVGPPPPGRAASGTAARAGSGAGTAAGSGTGTGSGAGTGTGPSAGTGAGSGTGLGPGTGSAAGADAGTSSPAGAEPDRTRPAGAPGPAPDTAAPPAAHLKYLDDWHR